jgi:hypothetical protein
MEVNHVIEAFSWLDASCFDYRWWWTFPAIESFPDPVVDMERSVTMTRPIFCTTPHESLHHSLGL